MQTTFMDYSDDISLEDEEKLKLLQEEIEKYRVQLDKCDYIENEDEFFSLMSDLWKFISSVRDAKLYDQFEASEYFQKYRPFFRAKEYYYVRASETIEAVSIMTREPLRDQRAYDLLDSRLAKETYNQTNRELEMLDIVNCKKLVMVGCGPLPETLLYLYENTDVDEIIGLDSNQEAIYMAGKMLRSQGIKKIKLQHEPGPEYDFSEADIIHIANFSTQKKSILKRIAETAQSKIQIIIRTPILFGRMFYESIETDLPNSLELVKEGEPNRCFLFKPFLLKILN